MELKNKTIKLKFSIEYFNIRLEMMAEEKRGKNELQEESSETTERVAQNKPKK